MGYLTEHIHALVCKMCKLRNNLQCIYQGVYCFMVGNPTLNKPRPPQSKHVFSTSLWITHEIQEKHDTNTTSTLDKLTY